MKKAGYLAVTAACLLSTVIMGAKTVYAANDTVEAARNVTNISDEQADVVAKAMESLGMGVTYVDVDTGLTFNSLYDIIRYLDANSLILETENKNNLEDGFRKDIAQEIWNLVNAERTANGIPALAWDDTVYEFSCQRAQALVNDFSHNGSKKGSDGENILMNYTIDANTLHKQWYNSSGHHSNYMYDGYERGACAVYVYNGNVYAVENFKVPDDVWTVYKYEHRYELVPTWTASNGVILRIEGPQSITTYDGDNPRATEEMIQAAVLEYYGVDNSSSSLTETSEPTYEIIDSAQTEPDTWTASNGVTVYVMNGNAYTINDGYSEDDHFKAWQEYTQSH